MFKLIFLFSNVNLTHFSLIFSLSLSVSSLSLSLNPSPFLPLTHFCFSHTSSLTLSIYIYNLINLLQNRLLYACAKQEQHKCGPIGRIVMNNSNFFHSSLPILSLYQLSMLLLYLLRESANARKRSKCKREREQVREQVRKRTE